MSERHTLKLTQANHAKALQGVNAAVTKGKAGSVVVTADDLVEVPAHQVPKLVDTTGAGDAFCGVLAAALALGHDESHAMDAALAAGASAVRRVGDQADPEL